MESLYVARTVKKKKINHAKVSGVLTDIKSLMRDADTEGKIVLAEAGILINKLLLK